MLRRCRPPELKQDPRFAKNHLRHQNSRELIPLNRRVTSDRPRDTGSSARGAGVPRGLLQTYDQVSTIRT